MRTRQPDYILLIATALLMLFGLAILSSASSVISYENFKNTGYYLTHQIFYGLAPGVIIAFAVYKINYQNWKKLGIFALIAAIALLIMVFLPSTSISHGGAKRWIEISIPMAGSFSFQSAEFAKLAFILYLAAWFEKRDRTVKSFKNGFLPFAFLLAIVSVLLLAQPDMGTLIIIAVSSAAVFFLAGAKIKHLAVAMLSGIILFGLAIVSAPYRLNRLLVFINPDLDPQSAGYQISQALLAIGSGGLFGRGLGGSRQKFDYLPESMGDSVFAIIGEEFGFIGAIFVIAIFLIYAWRGFRIALKAPDVFGSLLAGGITSMVIFQAMINIAAISALVPLTGIPLPFISYGGSSMIIFIVSTAILLNISKQIRD